MSQAAEEEYPQEVEFYGETPRERIRREKHNKQLRLLYTLKETNLNQKILIESLKKEISSIQADALKYRNNANEHDIAYNQSMTNSDMLEQNFLANPPPPNVLANPPPPNVLANPPCEKGEYDASGTCTTSGGRKQSKRRRRHPRMRTQRKKRSRRHNKRGRSKTFKKY